MILQLLRIVLGPLGRGWWRFILAFSPCLTHSDGRSRLNAWNWTVELRSVRAGRLSPVFSFHMIDFTWHNVGHWKGAVGWAQPIWNSTQVWNGNSCSASRGRERLTLTNDSCRGGGVPTQRGLGRSTWKRGPKTQHDTHRLWFVAVAFLLKTRSFRKNQDSPLKTCFSGSSNTPDFLHLALKQMQQWSGITMRSSWAPAGSDSVKWFSWKRRIALLELLRLQKNTQGTLQSDCSCLSDDLWLNTINGRNTLKPNISAFCDFWWRNASWKWKHTLHKAG